MGIFQQFPYSNFHEMNLDQIIKIMREMQDEWIATKAEWASYKDFIDNYFDNLDVSEEVLEALRTMAASGELNTIMDPTIAAETAAWLADHITQPTTPAIDTSLTVAGAAADAKVTGEKITGLKNDLNNVSDLISFGDFNHYPTISNGSLDNPANVRLVHTSVIDVVPYCRCSIGINRSPGVGNYYKFGWRYWDRSGNVIDNVSPSDGRTSTSFVIPQGVYAAAFVIGEWSPNDSAFIALRETDFLPNSVVFNIKPININERIDEVKISPFILSTEALASPPVYVGSYYSDGTMNYTDYNMRTSKLPIRGYDVTSIVSGVCEGYKIKAIRFFLPDINDTNTYTNVDSGEFVDDYVCTEVNDEYNVVAFVVSRKDITDTTALTAAEQSDIASKLKVYASYQDSSKYIPFTLKGLDGDGLPVDSPRRLLSNYTPIISGEEYIVEVAPKYASSDSFALSISLYDADDGTTPRLHTVSYETGTCKFRAPNDVSFMRVLIRNNTDTALDRQSIKSIKVTRVGSGKLNYYIDSGFSKRRVSILKLNGALTRKQSFCMYDDKWFSTDGSYIAQQDLDFTAISDTALALGHGNAMQVGFAHPNYAYVSGWNDQKIYVVDLDDLTIVETINLPTTGYTTCVVDDVNRIAYIFQRSDTPDTVDFYNFIIYDIDNTTILRSKKITPAMAAMQGVDYIDGKIVVFCGTGTVAKPNGYYVFNTNGDLIGEYVISAFSTFEPEGVFVDRATKDLYISLGTSGYVYEIQMI